MNLKRLALVSILILTIIFNAGLNICSVTAVEYDPVKEIRSFLLKNTYTQSDIDYNEDETVNVYDIIMLKKSIIGSQQHTDETTTSSTTETTTPDVSESTETTTPEETTTPKPTTTTTKATTTTTTSKETTTTTTTTTIPNATKISNVKAVYQYPELPTGCEATALTITLNWYGFNIDKVTLATVYMPQLEFYTKDGKLYGADFMTTFPGSPLTSSS